MALGANMKLQKIIMRNLQARDQSDRPVHYLFNPQKTCFFFAFFTEKIHNEALELRQGFSINFFFKWGAKFYYILSYVRGVTF